MTELFALATAAAIPISKLVEVVRNALGSFGRRLPSWTWAVLAMSIGAAIALVAELDVNDIPAEAPAEILRALIGTVAGAAGSLVHRVDGLLGAKKEAELSKAENLAPARARAALAKPRAKPRTR